MAARTKARKRAVDLLFAAEAQDRSALTILQEEQAAAARPGGRPVHEYTADLVSGIEAHQPRIDEIISSFSRGWTLSRMPSVDRNVLRVSVFEILYGDPEVPVAVSVSEALQLVRELSTDDSPSFVNGLLGAVVTNKETLVTG